MKGRRFWAAALTVCLAAGMIGCGNSGTEKKPADPSSEETGEQSEGKAEGNSGGGATAKDVLTIGMGNAITTLDL